MQMEMAKAPDLPDTPFILDYAKSDLDRRALELIFTPTTIGWPLVAPARCAGRTRCRIATRFRRDDEESAVHADVTKLDIDPVLGAGMDAVVRRIAGYDTAVVQRAQDLGGP